MSSKPMHQIQNCKGIKERIFY